MRCSYQPKFIAAAVLEGSVWSGSDRHASEIIRNLSFRPRSHQANEHIVSMNALSHCHSTSICCSLSQTDLQTPSCFHYDDNPIGITGSMRRAPRSLNLRPSTVGIWKSSLKTRLSSFVELSETNSSDRKSIRLSGMQLERRLCKATLK